MGKLRRLEQRKRLAAFGGADDVGQRSRRLFLFLASFFPLLAKTDVRRKVSVLVDAAGTRHAILLCGAQRRCGEGFEN